MEQDLDNKEVTINFKQIWDIIFYRKYWIIACYAIVIITAIIITFLLPKHYVSKAKIMINKGSFTNLNEINPFVLSEMNTAGGLSFLNAGGSNDVSDDIEIIKSPIVMDRVIKENNLRYEKGTKKGQFLSVDDLLDKNLLIDSSTLGSNIILVSYKSANPELAYNIVRSIVNSYKETLEYLNLEKATKDRKFLAEAYINAKRDLDKKFTILKEYNLDSENNVIGETSSADLRFTLLTKIDKRISGELKTLPKSSIENKKLGISIEGEIAKLKFVKEKYEWSVLVENMSKNATNLMIIDPPKLKTKDDYSEPKLLINILLSLVISFFLALSVVVYIEKNDEKISYLDLSKGYSYFNINEIKELETELILNNTNKLGVISLIDKNETDKIVDKIKENIQLKDFTILLTQKDNTLEQHFKSINESKSLIFLLKMGISKKQIFKNLISVINKYDIRVLKTFLIK